MKTQALPLAALILAAAAQATARESAPQSPEFDAAAVLAQPKVTLAELLAVADARNPDYREALLAARGAEGAAREAGLYPNPSAGAQHRMLMPSAREEEAGETALSLSQPLIVGGRRGAAVAVEQARQQMLAAQAETVRRDRHARIRELFLRAIHANQSQSLHFDHLIVADETVQLARQRHDGNSEHPDVLRATLNADRANTEVLQFITTQTVVLQELQVLLGGGDIQVERLDGNLLNSIDLTFLRPLEESLVDDHPALQASKLDVDRADRALRLARAEVIPDVTARIEGGYDHRANEEFFGAGIVVPIPIFDRNQGRIAEAEARAQEARIALADQRRELVNLYREQLQVVSELDTIVGKYRDALVPAAEKSFASLQRAYADGEIDFLALLDAQRTLYDVKASHLNYRLALSLAHSELVRFLPPEEGARALPFRSE